MTCNVPIVILWFVATWYHACVHHSTCVCHITTVFVILLLVMAHISKSPMCASLYVCLSYYYYICHLTTCHGTYEQVTHVCITLCVFVILLLYLSSYSSSWHIRASHSCVHHSTCVLYVMHESCHASRACACHSVCVANHSCV